DALGAWDFQVTAAADLQPMFELEDGDESHWLGADCATSLPGVGPGGSTLWVFQDTLVGAFDKSAGRRSVRCMPHNSLGVASRIRTDPPLPMRHLLRGDCTGSQPGLNGFFAPANTSQFYWVETGARNSEGKLLLFAQRMSLPCGIGCTQYGIDMIEVEDEISWNFSTRELPARFWVEGMSWPTAIAEDGAMLFLLGIYGSSAILARIPHAAFGSNWEALNFYCLDGDGLPVWLPVPDNGVQFLNLVRLFEGAAPETSLEYNSLLKKWLTISIPFQTPYLQVRLADAPTGPWSAAETIYRIPPPWGAAPAFTYSPKSHRELTKRPDELILTYMSNSRNDTFVAHEPRVYVPQVLRVQLVPKREQQRQQQQLQQHQQQQQQEQEAGFFALDRFREDRSSDFAGMPWI
ncbi:unnamed protein product, partial [Polarella glacialis]